jgi:putative FmdB family regulatory protein
LPLYEYECTKCKRHFERLQKFSDKPAKLCPNCGAPAQRLISSPAIQFKGTGWYVTDYGKGGGSTEGKDGKDGKEAKPGSADSAKEKAPAPAASESSKSKESTSPSTATPKP